MGHAPRLGGRPVRQEQAQGILIAGWGCWRGIWATRERPEAVQHRAGSRLGPGAPIPSPILSHWSGACFRLRLNQLALEPREGLDHVRG